MADPKTAKAEVKTDDTKKKGFLGSLKDKMDDREEQLEILSTFVRLGILVWSGGILTLAYVDLPPALQIPKQDLDPTFIASVFTGVLATFGVQTANKKNGNGAANGGGVGITKADMEKLIEAARSSGPVQTIKVEQAPLKITTEKPTEEKFTL